VEKLEVIREVDKNKRRKNEIAGAYGITLSTLSMYLKNRDSNELQGFGRARYLKMHEDSQCKAW
jgi:predicted transcriptional regulator